MNSETKRRHKNNEKNVYMYKENMDDNSKKKNIENAKGRERKISEKNLDNNTKKNTKTTKSVKTKILEKILAIIQKIEKEKLVLKEINLSKNARKRIDYKHLQMRKDVEWFTLRYLRQRLLVNFRKNLNQQGPTYVCNKY